MYRESMNTSKPSVNQTLFLCLKNPSPLVSSFLRSSIQLLLLLIFLVMETQDHKITTPLEHENHGTHLCHKCSWPLANPHPSARHRRAHKKVCGKVEGYKLSESEAGNSTHSAVSDDEHHSDGDQQTPSPIGKKVKC